MATKSAGRVSIRVLPDSSRFREDLKKSLERIEKTMKAEIPAHLVLTRESIRKLKEQLRDLEVRIKVEPFLRQEDLHNLKKKIEDIDPDVHVGLNTLNARRQLATLTRTRTVSIIARVNKASLVAAATALSALTGQRLVGNIFKDFFDGIKNLDKNAPKIGLIATGITTLVGALGAGVSNAAALAGSLAALGQTAVLLPTLMTAVGISVGTLVAVLKDAKTVLADLAPGFHDLQDAMSREFWAIAAQPIREMVNHLMPSLREQLINTSQVWGVIFREMANGLKELVTPKLLNDSFDNMNQAIARAAGAVKPLLRAFITLGTFGSQYLPRLSAWLVDLSKQFDTFIQKAAKSGDLEKWAERGIQEFKDLGNVIKEAFRIFGALTDAANQAGGSGFAELAGGLKKLADMMNTSNFQTGLITILDGAHKAMDGLVQGIENLGPGLAKLAPTLNTVFGEVGQTLARLGDALSDLFADPVLNQGLKDFFSGFKSFIDELRPAMGPLGTIIGTLATALGSLLAQAAPLVSDILTLMAPLFVAVWEAIRPLIPDIMQLVRELLPPFSEILTVLAREVLPELVPIIAELAPIFVDLVKALAPVIITWLKDFAQALKDAQPAIAAAADAIRDISDALNGFPLAFFEFFSGDKLNFFKILFGIAIDHPEIPAFFTALNTALGGLFDKIMGAANTVEIIVGLASALKEMAGPNVLGLLVSSIGFILALLPQWEAFWQRFGAVVQLIMGALPQPVQIGLTTIQTAITVFQLVTGPAWQGFWSRFGPIVATGMNLAGIQTRLGTGGIAATIAGFIAANLPTWQVWLTTIQTTISTRMPLLAGAIRGGIPGMVVAFAGMAAQTMAEFTRGFNALIALVPGFMARIGAGITLGAGAAIGAITGMGSDMVNNLFSFVGDFFSAGSSLITAFAQGIGSGQNLAVTAAIAVVKAAMSVLPHSPAEKGPLSGQGWLNLKKSGTAITRQFASGLTSDLSVVQNKTGQVVSAIQFGGAGVSTSSARSAMMRDRAALVNIEGDYYGATPEQVGKDFDTRLRRNALASQLGKVGIG